MNTNTLSNNPAIANVRVIKFTGHITTVSPVTVSPHNADIKKSKDVSNAMPKDTAGRPMIPATTLRGFIRNNARLAIQYALATQDKLLDVDTIYMLGTGVDTARLIEAGTSDGAKKQSQTQVGINLAYREQNPFLSLFGRWKLAGKLGIGNAVASSPNALVLLGGGVRQHPSDRDDTLVNFISPDELAYLDDILAADQISSEQTKELTKQRDELFRASKGLTYAEKQEINQQIDEIEQQIKEIAKERIGSDNTIRRPLPAFEAIDADQELKHTITLQAPTGLEFKLAVWCLAMVAFNPYVGGHKNTGCGQISAEWEVTESKIFNLEPTRLGKVGFNQDGFFCDIEGVTKDDLNEITQKIISGELDFTKYALD